MKQIIILDFCLGNVHIFPYDPSQFEDSSEFFDTEQAKELNLTEANCQYMVSAGETIEIQHHG